MKTQISLLALIIATPALSQEIVTLPTLSLTANLAPIEIDQTGASVTIIDEEELEKAGDARLSDHLKRVAGLSIDSSGGMGTLTYASIRGARAENIAVFVDGIRMDDPTAIKGEYEFGSISTNNISRIEVLRGSQSALYGGSAIGGVIDITTKGAQKQGFGGQTKLEYGSYNTINGALSLGYKGTKQDIALNYSKTMSDGFSAFDENQGGIEADGFDGQQFSLRAAYQLDPDLQIGINGFYHQSEYDFDDTGADNPDNMGKKEQSGARLFANFDNGTHREELSITTSQIDREQYTTTYGPYTFKTKGDRLEIRHNGGYQINPSLLLNYGAEYRQDAIELTDGSTINSHSTALLAGLNYETQSGLNLELTGRYEDHSSFGALTSWRAAMAWSPSENWIMRAVASTGFRAPTPYELYDQYYGNPNLEPETSQSYELGLERKFGDQGQLGITAFYIEAENYLDYDPNTYLATNIAGTSVRQGIEISGQYTPTDRIDLGMNYTYTDAKDGSGQQMARIPTHNLNIYGDFSITDALEANLSANHVADHLDRVYGVETLLEDYTVVNARLAYQIGQGQAYLRVENLFNEEYQTTSGYGTSDRAYYVGYSLDF